MFEATLGPIDEDGYRGVRITGPGYDESYTLRYDHAGQWVEQELAILNGPQGDCEHGLSLALCSGPRHF